MLDTFNQSSFEAPLADGTIVCHDVYTKGESDAVVVVVQELPGIGAETIELADILVSNGFRVVLPHLFGPLGRTSMLGNTLRVFCMRKEFQLFAKQKSSPIVDWLRALCLDLKQNHNARAIGVIGMCLTGNFAMSLMADDNVLAGVASQPSMPIGDQNELHMYPHEIIAARKRLESHGPMLALRFKEDPLCTAKKFDAIDRAFNRDQQRIKLVELPGKGHSVLTLDLRRAGEFGEQALDEVLNYFKTKLSPQTA